MIQIKTNMTNVKTTKIEKKYKDKKTGEYKSITIEHAKVKDRLKAFWEQNPMGKIETKYEKDADTVVFSTFILADKSNEFSREATGHAMANLPLGDKDYEKLETISVGRALALLGYATDGEVASFEEMEDFVKFKEEKKETQLREFETKLLSTKTEQELREVWATLPSEAKLALEKVKDELKKEYLPKKKKNENA